MNITNCNVFVAGGTGRVGRYILQKLIAQDCTVYALVRNKSRANETLRDLPQEKIKYLEGDISHIEELHNAFKTTKFDGVICTVGARAIFSGPDTPYHIDYQGVVNLVDSAKESNVNNFVLVSSVNVTKTFSGINLLARMGHWKFQAEQHLRKSGLDYVIVRPGILDNQPGGKKPLEFGQGDHMSFRFISRDDVGTCCVESLKYLLSRKGQPTRLTYEVVYSKSTNGATEFSQLKSD